MFEKSRSDSHFDNTPNKVNLWTGWVDEIFYNEKQKKKFLYSPELHRN